MNRRLQQFLSAENISQSQLADTIGVARASISHILAGRNKPGFEFIERMARHYPELSLEWLVTGRGKMYVPASGRNRPTEEDGTLFDDAPGTPAPGPAAVFPAPSDSCVQSGLDQKHIAKIIVFYSDGSFAEIE